LGHRAWGQPSYGAHRASAKRVSPPDGGVSFNRTGAQRGPDPKAHRYSPSGVRPTIQRQPTYWDKGLEWEQGLKRYERNPDVLVIKEIKDKEEIRVNLAKYESTWKHEYSWPKLNRGDGR